MPALGSLGASLAGLLAGGSALVAYATLHRNSQLFGPVLTRLPGDVRSIALTFDDGPNPEATPRLLDLLGECGVVATFFLLGKHVQRWPVLARRVHDEGHLVANHGFTHRRLDLAGPGRARRDIADGAAAIAEATGAPPRYFRPPHGARSPFVGRAAESLGQRSVGWTIGSRDHECPGSGVIAHRVVSRAHPGAIVLLHDGDAYAPTGSRLQTVEAVARLVPTLRERGFAFAALPR